MLNTATGGEILIYLLSRAVSLNKSIYISSDWGHYIIYKYYYLIFFFFFFSFYYFTILCS